MEQYSYARAKALLEKYHTGKCTTEELALLEQWYHRLGEGASGLMPEDETDFYKQQFLTRFNDRYPVQKRVWISRPLVRWAAAACIILLAGLGYVLISNTSSSSPAQQLAENKVHSVTNETDHVRKVTLNDSSVIWLNSHASLSWKDDFNGNSRSVELTGEGFFDVHKDKDRPFIIHTRNMDIRVLGTAFNVETYQKENMTRVSLVHGSVQVRAIKDSSLQAILKPGYAASFSDGAGAIDISETDADMAGAWKEGSFAVRDITIYDAVRRLCEKNGYNVQWTNTKDNQKTISITFNKENFEEIMSNLCYMIHKEYKITGKQVTIY